MGHRLLCRIGGSGYGRQDKAIHKEPVTLSMQEDGSHGLQFVGVHSQNK